MHFFKLWSGRRHSSTVYFSFLVAAFFVLISNTLQAQAVPCGCTNCPQFMPDGFTGSFLINVQNASNPTLGQNGQGICGVTMHIEHEYIGDLRITLTSPSGQQVTLIGPIGFFGPTDNTDWNITFVPCTDPAAPDPGFSATWNNNQPWGLGGMYTGSYYPSAGCLNNITGPVNGTWTLTVTDGQAIDVGTFFDYDIIFCDPSGINCFSCAANAGNLLQPDVVSCEGAANLDLTLPPTWSPANTQPPASDYSYTYVIAGPGGVIQAFDPNADLTAYPAGAYTVCGMSYLTAQADLVPEPNGSLTINQLSTQLNSGTAPFCGKITTNCVNVTINPAPEDEDVYEEICAPACYNFHGTNYCTSGTYVKNLTQAGCPYTGTLHLIVHPLKTVNLTETICDGGCVTNPAFPGVCAGGSYQEVLQTVHGCDSTVNLNVIVLSVSANIQPPQNLPCNGGSIQLSGSGSSPGVNYHWTASNGGNISSANPNTQNVTVNAPGDYQLRVCRTQNGVTCCDSMTTTVISNTDPPPAPAQLNGDQTPCQGQAYNYSVSAVTGATSYTWTVPSGATINSGGTGTTANITWNTTTPGDICVTANNACGQSTPLCVTVTPDAAPVVTQPTGPATACVGDVTTFSIPAVANASSYTWTVPGSATIVSGQGTESIDIQWNTAFPSGNVCVRATNTCGQSPQQCFSVSVGAAPAAPNLTGNTTACTGTNTNYSFPALAGASAYTWTVTGGSFTSGGTTSSTTAQVLWNTGITNGQVCATANNACGNGPSTCVDVTLSSPVGTPTVTGQNALCAGATGVVYSITAVPGASGYTWAVPAGATLVSGQNTTSITVDWAPNATSGSICVSANASCGASPQGCFPVTVNAVPNSVAGTDQDLCGNSTTLSATPSVGTGQWTQVSGLGTATFTAPTAANSGVSVSANGTYTFRWTETNGGTCTDNDVVTVNFNASPTTGNVTRVCDGANENYTVSFPISGGTAPYTVSGGTVSNGVFTSTPIPSGTPYTFIVDDVNGCQSGIVSGSFTCNCSSDAGTMATNTLSACEGLSITVQHDGNQVLDANDVSAYVLHTGSSNTIVNPIATNTTGTFSFQTGMTYGQTYYVSFVVASNNGSGQPNYQDPCLSVSQGQPIVFYQNPTANAGADQDICGSTLNMAASGSGVWSVLSTPTGGSLTINNPTDPATGLVASSAGLYTLVWTVTANGCTTTATVTATFNDNPILADLTRTCDNTNENFTVTLTLSGGTAPYSVNGTTVSGTTFTSAAFPNNTVYTFNVTDANGCTMPQVTGAFSCICATDAGTMAAPLLTACESGTVTATANNDASLDGNDVVAYVLHTGAGPALGTIIAQNTTGTFGFNPATMNYGVEYYISRIVGNPLNGQPNPADPCFSVATGQPVTFLQIPVPDAGTAVQACGNTLSLGAVQGSFTGQWSLVTPAPGTATFVNSAVANTSVSVSQSGIYTFRWTETNGTCVGTDDVQATFYEIPTVATVDETCNNTNTQYNVTVQISGGTAPYTINGLNGSFSGATFTSAGINTSQTYSFTVSDAHGCTVGPVSGSKNCNCATDAGSMVTSTLTFCADQPAVATWNNDATLDGDDAVQFILHTQGGSSPGQVLATAATPQFNFGAGLSLNTTYYISAIAGNSTGGVVDLNDDCLSVAPGTPVRWKPLPTASLTGDATLCEGDGAALTFNGTGTYPLTVFYQLSTGDSSSFVVQNAQGGTLPVTPAATVTYTLTRVTDGTLPACTTNESDAVTVTVNQPSEAGTATLELDICAEEGTVVQLSDLLTNADPGGQWIEVSVNPSLTGTFDPVAGTFNTTGQQPGKYDFRYKVTPLAPCPSDEVVVTVNVRPQPVADAGQDRTIDCLTLEVSLGGTETTTGQGVTYAWSNPNISVGLPTTATFTTGESGAYQLLVTNNFGCTDTDDVVVSVDNDKPSLDAVAVHSVRCFGEQNGSISVGNLTGGTPPFLFSLNGAAFTSTSSWLGLAPGVYSLEVVDANGCSDARDSLEVIEPVQLVANLGADVAVQLGDSATATVQLNVPLTRLDTIVWSPLLDTLRAGTVAQQFFPIHTHLLEVKIVDTSGCTATDRIYFLVDTRRHIYVPNIFQPSSSENNVVAVFGGNDVAEIELFQVFDRWGDQVHQATNFQPNDVTKGWGGRFGDRDMQPAVYVWTVIARFKDGEREVFSGDVTLMR